ncbi:MAG: dienelactone hydrolase family protein [Fimbriimonas ginsengisoli]|uniref:Dienelactone hydrolase family protein n=1 Tax=Fimbriimonas ginsengisoli TaxID=1005039 RepID=A0A931LSM8_FIMGI|nr:dienelactone hydrolase family protein [Fimbriimonas ginsengisoli]MBI3721030.1 dienelactone hydrolase family protein [Fimbriimonas ginsengisoli]
MKGTRIKINGESNYEGYLAVPDSGRGTGVIVIQEWWGLVGHIMNVADRFAEEGFVALAPDLFLGKTAEEPEEAGKLMMALNIAETEKILARAVKFLLAQPATEGEKVGVVGYCMGGQLSLFAAATNPQVGACADFYGIHPNVHPPFANLQAPVLGFFAEHDDYANAAAVAALDAELTRAGKAHEFHTFPGVHHAFCNDDRPVYDGVAAGRAWSRMLEFFRQNLKA